MDGGGGAGWPEAELVMVGVCSSVCVREREELRVKNRRRKVLGFSKISVGVNKVNILFFFLLKL